VFFTLSPLFLTKKGLFRVFLYGEGREGLSPRIDCFLVYSVLCDDFRWIPRMVFVVVLNTFAFVSDLQAIRGTFFSGGMVA
jgi:hypothetical protein